MLEEDLKGIANDEDEDAAWQQLTAYWLMSSKIALKRKIKAERGCVGQHLWKWQQVKKVQVDKIEE